MWRSFWANCRIRGWQRLGRARRLRILSRCVHPLVRFYLAPVPPGASYIERLNRLQKCMTRMLLCVRPYPTEPYVAFRRRSAREARRTIEAYSCWWAREWIRSANSWRLHLLRDLSQQALPFESRTCYSWASLLLGFKNAAWINARREVSLSGSRTHTRLPALGKVNLRWEETVQASMNLAL